MISKKRWILLKWYRENKIDSDSSCRTDILFPIKNKAFKNVFMLGTFLNFTLLTVAWCYSPPKSIHFERKYLYKLIPKFEKNICKIDA